MARTCNSRFQGREWKGGWDYADGTLSLSPESGAPLAFALKEMAGISGDGYSIELNIGDEALTLEKLGAEGPTLLDLMRRDWLPARARALRLLDGEAGMPYTGAIQCPEGSGTFEAIFPDDALLVAVKGGDVRPMFLSLARGVAFDETAYQVVVPTWEGETWLFSKMAGRTEEFRASLAGVRDRLAKEALEVLSTNLPTLAPGVRATLAGIWMAGRVLNLADLEAAAPGFGEAFEKSWLGRSLRKREGIFLRDWADPDGVYLAYGSPGESSASSESDEGSPVAEGEDAPGPAATGGEPEVSSLLRILVRKGKTWCLEALTEKDHATYCFEGGDEMPALASRMLSAPQFSWESLGMPLEALTGERADYAIAARDLPFLRDLRSRFRRRVLHISHASWKREIESPGRS